MRFLGRFSLIAAVVFTALCSCSKRDAAFDEQSTPYHFRELQPVSSMMTLHPEQALQRLEAVEPSISSDSWSELERHEFRVLKTEAQYKLGRLDSQSYPLDATVTYLDSLAVTYPDDVSLRFLRANACYYLATENTIAQQDVEAASHYVKALKTLRSGKHAADDDRTTRLFALCHYRLGEILYEYNIQASARNAFDSAQIYFEKVHDTFGVAASIRSVGEVYQGNKDYERALAKFKEANKLWDFGEALYDHAIGGMFFQHHQYDSACAYLERSFLTGGPYTRIDASAKLAEIWREKGDKGKEDYYTVFYVQNSIRETNRSSDKMEIEFIYDELNPPQTIETPRQTHWGLILLVALAGAVIAVMAYIIIRNRHRISHIEQQISSMEKTHREETEGKDRQLKDMSRELDATKQQLERRKKIVALDVEAALDRFLKAPVVLKVKKSVEGKDIMTKSVGLYPNLKLSEMEFIEIVRTVNTFFPDFSSHFLKDFSELSTSDLRHCSLALMGLNDAEIAVMEGITYSGANRRTKRILSVMRSDAGLEETVLVYLNSLYK